MATDLPHTASGVTMAQPHATQAQIAVLWLRRDLRVADNPALVAALQAAVTVVRAPQSFRCIVARLKLGSATVARPPRHLDVYPPAGRPFVSAQ